MQLTNAQIRSFQDLYQAQFGIALSDDEALAQGLSLMGLMARIYKPMTYEQHAQYEDENKPCQKVMPSNQ